MGVKAAGGVLLTLSIMLANGVRAQQAEPKLSIQTPTPTPTPKGREEASAREASRLADQLKRHPARRSALKMRRGLYLMDLVQGDVTLIADEPDPGADSCGSPRWSHDGRRILFDAMPNMAFNLLRIKAIEVGPERPTLTDLGPGARPTFSPDDKRIAFLINPEAVPGSVPGIWVMSADGSKRRLAGEEFGMPLWSPDGRQFLIVGFEDPRMMTMMNLERPHLSIMGIQGAQVYGWPSWADMGTVAAIIGARGVGDTVALLDVSNPDRPKIKEVLWKPGKDLDVQPLWPVYAPVTRRCVFVGVEPNGMALYSVEHGQSGQAKRLEAGPLDRQIGGLAFSPDGRFLLFCSNRPDRPRP
jgi:Tol biopolymer transport system component